MINDLSMPLSDSRQQETIQVWADIGGTFTDVFILRKKQRQEIKVLSSGLTRAAVREYHGNETFSLHAYLGITCCDFWRGANAVLIDRNGRTVDLGAVISQNKDRLITEHAPAEKIRNLSGPLILELNPRLEAPVLATRLLLGIPLRDALPPLSVRLGTTKGTNALLTRKGSKIALLVTKGFRDLLSIGEQDRPELFSLNIKKTAPLAEHVIEIDERLDASGTVLQELNPIAIEKDLADALAMGVESIAICLLHGHRNSVHEQKVESLAREAGFCDISRSSEVAPLIKYVARAETTSLDAYLNPVLDLYLKRVWNQFGGANTCRLQLMTSNGNLVEPNSFRGRDSILSGPAGGVVALGDLASQTGQSKVIGLDMGGTSTDVSRYEGKAGRRYESRVAGIRVMTPMMDIETVAAGGGSICGISDLGRLSVGPESAGAEPGPACYGKGGPLTVTDINLILGRIPIERFPFPLDRTAAEKKLLEIASRLPHESALSPEALAEGFFDIAITHMAEAVRTVSTAQGSDVREMALAGFGGAAGQHLCRIADTLGMKTIIDHPDAGLLSALGIGIAKTGHLAAQGIYRIWDGNEPLELESQMTDVKTVACEKLAKDKLNDQIISERFEIDIRYQGTESPLTLEVDPQRTLANRFHQQHLETFGYCRENHSLEIVAIRCEATIESNPQTAALETSPSLNKAESILPKTSPVTLASYEIEKNEHEAKTILRGQKHDDQISTKLWHQNRWVTAKRIDRSELTANQVIEGPAIIAGHHSTFVLEPHWQARVDHQGVLVANRQSSVQTTTHKPLAQATIQGAEDPILLEVICRRLQGIADAMGEVLRRTSLSVNIKERRDYSCAIFNEQGVLIANAPHVPVHLGAMGHTVRHLINKYPTMYAGDCYLSNDPFAGGSHLPDVTAVAPVFCGDRKSGQPDFFVASRAHHAEIGGISPGSMPPHATSLAQEGVLIQNFALVRNGEYNREQLYQLLVSAEYPSRCPHENLADIDAQRAAGIFGIRSLQELATVYSASRLRSVMEQILDISGQTVQNWIQTLPQKPLHFRDQLDDGTSIAVQIEKQKNRLIIRFETDPVHPNGFNATPAIVTAAVLYVIRCLAGSHLPLCEGALRDIDLVIPPGLLDPPRHADPHHCAAVVAGNVETSQRIVDVLLGALDSAAASQGTMNNMLLGNESFGYYETIAGGSGATAESCGADAVHTHMTNTRITDPEVLESRLPIRLLRFEIRRGSGGQGHHHGGDGVIREFEFLRPLVLSLITSRRITQPYGLHGGLPGQSGRNLLSRSKTKGENTNLKKSETLGFRASTEVTAGDRLTIETPGGGGWGDPNTRTDHHRAFADDPTSE